MTAAPWSAGDASAQLKLPAGAVDCHHHIYDHRFAWDEQTKLKPPEALVSDYRQLQERLGLERNVVIQPSSYGTDNTCLLDALWEFGENARGIAVIDNSISDGELEALHKVGVRGIRFNLSRPAGANIELLDRLCSRIAPFGWHAQIHTLGPGYLALEANLAALPVPVVIDHLGRIPMPEGLQHQAFEVLCRLVDNGRTWIKLSGAYQDTIVGEPSYSDTGRIITEWVRIAPERIVWGTDWPHPAAMVGEKPMPDDARLLDLMGEWAGDEAMLTTIFVDNPCELYGFAPVEVKER